MISQMLNGGLTFVVVLAAVVIVVVKHMFSMIHEVLDEFSFVRGFLHCMRKAALRGGDCLQRKNESKKNQEKPSHVGKHTTNDKHFYWQRI